MPLFSKRVWGWAILAHDGAKGIYPDSVRFSHSPPGQNEWYCDG
ncbi:hypothetical protein [Oculatella sp. LEGE 06141]|nr:hypothetical protein [Oculatella sp. LEGE 06141]